MTAHLDRDKARAWLVAQFGLPNLVDEISDDELDALEACVVQDPPQTIDRDKLRDVIRWSAAHAPTTTYIDQATDAILGLVRPAAGITLAPEEAQIALTWAKYLENSGAELGNEDIDLTLRLEEAAS